MRRGSGINPRDFVQPSRQQMKRKTHDENIEPSLAASAPSRRAASAKRPRVSGGSTNTQEQNDEHSLVRPRWKTRRGAQRRRAKSAPGTPTADVLLQPPKSQARRSTAPSPRQPLDLLSDGRSATLSAEPPVSGARSPASGEQVAFLEEYSKLENEARQKFLQHGDVSGLNTLLDPFRKGKDKKELSDWTYDKEKQRWWRKDMSTGMVIWAPTADSLL